VPSFVFQTLDDPNAGTGFLQGTTATSINSHGQIVGLYADAGNVFHGFLLSNGQYTTVDDPNAGTGTYQGTEVAGINNQGQIVGFYFDAGNVAHGFLLSHGQYTTLDDPNAGPGGTTVFSINDGGQMVGQYFGADGINHSFLLSHGQYTSIDDPSAVYGTYAYSINNHGQIAGSTYNISGIHGWLLSHGQYIHFDDPDATNSYILPDTACYGLNDSGQMVGSYTSYMIEGPYTVNDFIHGFLLSHGQYTTLDDPMAATSGNGLGTTAIGINDSGEIVGYYLDAGVVTHGFLATPSDGDVPFRGAGGPASASRLDKASGTLSVLVASAPLGNAAYPYTVTVSGASSYAHRGEGAGGMSTGQTKGIVTVPSRLEGSSVSAVGRAHVVSRAPAAAGKHSRVVVDALFARADDLFGSLELS
jgi:uncharacterized membrane protein